MTLDHPLALHCCPQVLHRKCKDTAMKNRLCIAKADELHIETAVLKTCCDSMLTRFGKLTKTASGDRTADNTERDQWNLNPFDFVGQHMMRIKEWMAGGLKVKLAQQATSVAAAVPPVLAPLMMCQILKLMMKNHLSLPDKLAQYPPHSPESRHLPFTF